MKKYFLIVSGLVSLYIVLAALNDLLLVEYLDQLEDETQELSIEKAKLQDSPKDGSREPSAERIETRKKERLIELKNKKAQREANSLNRVFGLIRNNLGDLQNYLLNLIAFGMFGAVIRLLIVQNSTGVPIDELKVYSTTILGGLLGLSTLLIKEIIPDFSTEEGNDKFYYTISLLSGIFSQEFFTKLENTINRNTEHS